MLKRFKNRRLAPSSPPINNLSVNGISQIQEVIDKFCLSACSPEILSLTGFRNLLYDSTYRFFFTKSDSPFML